MRASRLSRIAALEALPSLPDQGSGEFDGLPIDDRLRAVYGAALKNVPLYLAGERQGWGDACRSLLARLASQFAVGGAATAPLTSTWVILEPLLVEAVHHGGPLRRR